MEVVFADQAKKDIEYWKRSGNTRVQKKIQELLTDIKSNPQTGLGKPEQLKHELTGKWSRRINQEHRIIYDIENSIVTVLSLRGHYI